MAEVKSRDERKDYEPAVRARVFSFHSYYATYDAYMKSVVYFFGEDITFEFSCTEF